ncbi:MAG: sigma 54-interacting transcriptional regulator [Lachnospiraceae bacterium]|nr:sigma 54-interacting transcriptional regulator [Lachnospiraceae bacterium]
MKKKIAVITLIPRSGEYYRALVQELFGELVQVRAYSTGDRSVERIVPSDLYLVSTDAFRFSENAGRYVPADGQVVEIQLTYRKKVIQELKKIPEGTRALFVNVTRQMAREAITQLEQLGVTQIRFEPYGGDSLETDGLILDGIHLAVTPDESGLVPAGMEQIINIGHRPCDPITMIEAALRLELDELLEGKPFLNYMKSMAAKNYSFDQMLLRSRRLESRFDILLESLDEGMIGVNEKEEIIACNRKAADITGREPGQVLGKQGEAVFPYIPFGSCMKSRVPVPSSLIRIGSANINMAVVPVMFRGECLGAFAILQRFNELEKRQNELRSQLLKKGYCAKYRFEDVIGNSAPVRRTKAILRRMAVTESPVLLIGETGTGKELFAHAVHQASGRSRGPFVAINVAAMPENLLESELFGYEEGAFTGARKGGRPGLFEFAHKGTLFLDEVEGMSQAMQVKLLRVLQEQEIMRVGGNQIIHVDVRIVAATNESLEERVEEGSFRRDLYYRLNALPVLIPPLRERGDDIFLLMDHFKKRTGGEFFLSEEVRCLFLNYRWPGNIRELQNVVDYLSFTGSEVIGSEDLPPTFMGLGARKRTEAEEKEKKKTELCRGMEAYVPLDREMMEKIRREAGPEFWFVLEQLYQASAENRLIGRDGILKAARERHIPLSQRDIRRILGRMSELELASVKKGRGGSRITASGRQVWQMNQLEQKVDE